jgi:hypothetical protein
MGVFSWLIGGNDRQLAESRYAGRQSATDRASQKRRQSYRDKGISRAEKRARRWEETDRRRFGGR